jgi:hypothetical protein
VLSCGPSIGEENIGVTSSEDGGSRGTSSGTTTTTTTGTMAGSLGTTGSTTDPTGEVDSTGGPPITIEGTIVRTRWGSPVIVPCDGSFTEGCMHGVADDLASCSGVYVRATGHLVPGGEGWILRDCNADFDFEVIVVDEARRCSPSDCRGSSPCETTQCDFVMDCTPGVPDACDAGDRCALRIQDEPLPYRSIECTPISASPGMLGDACTVARESASGFDECDDLLHCRADDPGGSAGLCVPICGSVFAPDCSTGECAACDDFQAQPFEIGLCLPAAETVNGSC